MRIFISNLTPIGENLYKVGYVHYAPFAYGYGLNKTEEELLKEGALVEYVEPLMKSDDFEMIYDKNKNVIYYE